MTRTPRDEEGRRTPERFRVYYHLYAAGGRLWPTSALVEADSEEAAIREAERVQRQRDSERYRANTGYFGHASAVKVAS